MISNLSKIGKALHILVLLFFFGIICMGAECKDENKPRLAIRANLEGNSVVIGTELKPTISLVNISGKPLKLQYLKPSIVVPEIWDAKTNQRILNAPTYVYDQICASQESVLAPNEVFDLFSLPILIARESPPKEQINHLHGFWAPKPGVYILKYSVPLKNFLADATGELHAASLKVVVIDAAKR